MRVRRYRVVRRSAGTGSTGPAGSSGADPAGSSGADPAGSSGAELSAEKGHAKEAGNLLFHLSLVALLVALAGGKLWGYEGSILVTEGAGFCNSFQQYDTYSAGPLVEGGDLAPLCVDLDDFRAEYEDDLTASSFTADITHGGPGEDGRAQTIGVNDPLRVDGARVYLTGHGYAPTFTVTANGRTFTDVSAPFLPTDQATMASEGALKLPDLGADAESQLAIQGFFAPTGVVRNGILASVDPRPLEPRVAVVAYQGYLGLDSGRPQSVYAIDAEQIDRGALSRVGSANLAVGETLTLPDGTEITFTGYTQFAALQLSHDPGQVWVLGAAVAVLVGLLGMLLLRRERVFARVGPAAGSSGTVLTVGSLTRGGGEGGERFAGLTDDLRAALAARVPARPTPPAGGAAPDPEVPTP